MNRREFLWNLPWWMLGGYVAAKGYLKSMLLYPELGEAEAVQSPNEAAGEILPAITTDGQRMEFRLAGSSQWVEAKVNFSALSGILAWTAWQMGGDNYLGSTVEFVKKVGLRVKFATQDEKFALGYAPRYHGTGYPQLVIPPTFVTDYFRGIPRGLGARTVDAPVVHEMIHMVQEATRPNIGVAYDEASSWVFNTGSLAAGAKITKELTADMDWEQWYKNSLMIVSGMLVWLGTYAAKPYLNASFHPNERQAYALMGDPRFDTYQLSFDAMRGKLFDFVNL